MFRVVFAEVGSGRSFANNQQQLATLVFIEFLPAKGMLAGEKRIATSLQGCVCFWNRNAPQLL